MSEPEKPVGVRRRRSPLRLGVLALSGAAIVLYALVLFPYARGLWWLHTASLPPTTYVLPVDGVAPQQLSPSFGAPRHGGPHEGIDIMASAGTPVRAVAEGVVLGNRPSLIGGNVLWILGSGRRLYYYAHLHDLAPRMHMGRYVGRGEIIGTVGNTGNAEQTPPHLHFAIYVVSSDFYPFQYQAVDPYPLLEDSQAWE